MPTRLLSTAVGSRILQICWDKNQTQHQIRLATIVAFYMGARLEIAQNKSRETITARIKDEITQATAESKMEGEVATNLFDVLPLEAIVEVMEFSIEAVEELKKTNH